MELGDIVTRVTLDSTQFSQQMRRTSRELSGRSNLRKSIEDQFDLDNAASDFERNMVRINQRYRDTMADLRRAPLTTAERGDLVDKATASYEAQVRRLQESVPRVRQSANTIGQQYQGMSRTARNSLTQLAFATDDFFGVWQNSGNVGAAMRATSNNIGTLVTMMNPLAGIATTVALAFGSSLVNSFTAGGDAVEEFAGKAEKAIDAAERAARFRQEQRDFSAMPFEQRQEKLQTGQDQTAVALAKLREAEQQLRNVQSQIAETQSDFQTIPFPVIGPALFNVQKWWHSAGSEVTKQQAKIRAETEQHREAVERLRKEYERLQQLDAFRRGGEVKTAQRNAMIALEIGSVAGLLGATRGGELSTDDAVRERKALERDEKRMAREREKRERERQQRAEDFRDTQLDIQSQSLTGREKKEFDINRRFDEQQRRIFENAPDLFSAAALNKQNERQRQLALDQSLKQKERIEEEFRRRAQEIVNLSQEDLFAKTPAGTFAGEKLRQENVGGFLKFQGDSGRKAAMFTTNERDTLLRKLEMEREAALASAGGGGPTRFAGQFQQGSAEAFSEILRASGVADDQAKKAAKATADNTKNTADQTKAIADQLRLADSLLLIPSLGGTT